MAEADLDVQFVGDDEVFAFICELDAIIEVQEDFDTAGDKILEMNIEKEKCQSCDKTFKTVRGLLRHKASKQEKLSLPQSRLKSIMEVACQEIAADRCYGTEVNTSFELYCKERYPLQDGFISESSCNIIKKVLSKLVDKKSKELYYAEYYSELVNKSKELFPLLKEHEAPLLAIIVCERLMTEFQSVSKQPAPSVPQINDRDKQCIQYIGGYVLRKLYYSIKTDSPQNEIMKSIIICFKDDNLVDQLLISAVNRGGLWGIKRPVSNLFLAAERKFREATVGANITLIAISAITNKLLDDLNVRELFSSILEDCPAYEPKDDELAKNILQEMFTLFLRVRSFSYAKDIINRQKLKTTSGKKKSLRKELKQTNTDHTKSKKK
eukprot:gene16140-7502_t